MKKKLSSRKTTYKLFKSTNSISGKKTKKKTPNIANACNIYKKDISGKENKVLYKSCKINKYCRKYKCNDIDNKVKKILTNKFGETYPKLMFKYIKSECFGKKRNRKCENKAINKFYKENDLNELHDKINECNKKTCKKEKDIFYINLYRHNKQKFRKDDIPIPVEELEPDNEKQ